MNIENQYLDLLKTLLSKSNEPHQLRTDRTGTGTYATFGKFMEHDMDQGFPLLTTKKMHFKSIVSELLWFMRGQSDLRTLLQQKNKIWVGDAYKRYVRICSVNSNEFDKWFRDNGDGTISMFTEEQFIEQILTNDEFSEEWGQLGPIYGPQWRGYNSRNNPALVKYMHRNPSISSTFNVDQLQDALDKLRNDPTNRRILVSAWKPETLALAVLPPCHLKFQFFIEQMSRSEMKANPGYKQKLSLMWDQRSVDTFLGLAFNIASYALLLEIFARMIPETKADRLTSSLGDTHLYIDHIESSSIQVTRKPMGLPTIQFSNDLKFDGTLDEFLESITDFESQIQLNGYVSHSKIPAPLSN